MKGFSHESLQHRPAARCAGTLAVALGLVVALAGAPASVRAQGFFPTDPPVQFFGEDFEDMGVFGANWTLEGPGPYTLNWGEYSGSVACAGNGHWGGQSVQVWSSAGATIPLLALLVDSSLPEIPATFQALDWTSFRMEYDVYADSSDSVVGFTWAGSADRSSAYVVYVDQIPSAADVSGGARARWHLVKRTGGTNVEIANDQINFGAPEYTVETQHCYRLRLEWFCGNLQVSVRRFDFADPCSTGCTYGCGAGCTPTGDPESCWCPFIRWTDSAPLSAGATGIFTGTLGSNTLSTYVDNLVAASWGTGCTQVCTAWSPWSEDWANGDAHSGARDVVPFKLNFEAGLVDQRVGTNGIGRVDAEVLPPGGSDWSRLCEGWRELVSLPDPLAPPGSTEAALRAFLQPIATAVIYEAASGTFTWVNDFNNDPASPTYNPIPLVASGNTPIAAALLDAYNWYVGLRSGPDGAWSNDRLATCRKWFVVLITDGEEHCALDPSIPPPSYWTDYACEPGQAGAPAAAPGNSFADPVDTAGNALDPVQVHVIGFAGGVTGTPAIACVANNTGGQYYSAANASELTATLYDVFNNMVEADRAFLPIAVSPPPTQLGAAAEGDFLVLVPRFIPRNRRTIWEGHLYSFPVNTTNPTLPSSGGNLDLTQATWDANEALISQLRSGTPTRNVYWPYSNAGAWQRVVLDDVKTDATYRAEFRNQLLRPGLTDAEVASVVDFILFKNTTDRPQWYTDNSVALGDIFHSMPVIVSPPNNFSFFYNNLHSTDATPAPYTDFMTTNAHRRRVALAGANDSMLHAFDVGFYDRDTTNYANAFDLPSRTVTGSGAELFAIVPDGVVGKVYNMVTGIEQQYMVDGNITVADVFMDPPGGATPEWRTIAAASLREGGRSLLFLDVTHPDPPNTAWDAATLQFPGCLNNTETGCTGNYPTVLFEFTDTADANGNGEPDLGATWSPPVIARVQESTGAATPPRERWIAFFGGGWDETGTDMTGTYFYGVDVTTGQVVYKTYIGASLPGAAAALDANNDGWTDVVYFGTTAGDIYRLDVTLPSGSLAGFHWDLFKIFDFPDNQQFFTKPIIVPALFSGSTFTWGLALGSGDRPNVAGPNAEDGVEDRFYFVLDTYDRANAATHVTRTEANLQEIMYNDPATPTGTYLDPPTHYGWFIHLRVNEKVNADAIVAGEQVLFPTFEPTEAQPIPGQPVCLAGGTGRLYSVYYNNANPTDTTVGRGEDLGMGLIVGGTAYTIGDTTEAVFTGWQGGTEEREIAIFREHVVTNWRQD